MKYDDIGDAVCRDMFGATLAEEIYGQMQEMSLDMSSRSAGALPGFVRSFAGKVLRQFPDVTAGEASSLVCTEPASPRTCDWAHNVDVFDVGDDSFPASGVRFDLSKASDFYEVRRQIDALARAVPLFSYRSDSPVSEEVSYIFALAPSEEMEQRPLFFYKKGSGFAAPIRPLSVGGKMLRHSLPPHSQWPGGHPAFPQP